MPAKQNRITVKEAETETCAWVVTESSWRLVTAALTKSELCHESGEGEKYPFGYTLTASHTSDRPCMHFSNQTTNLWLTNCHCGSKQRHSDPERGRYTQTENVARASNKTHDSEIAHDDVVTHAEYIFTENDAVTETSAPDISTFNDCSHAAVWSAVLKDLQGKCRHTCQPHLTQPVRSRRKEVDMRGWWENNPCWETGIRDITPWYLWGNKERGGEWQKKVASQGSW